MNRSQRFTGYVVAVVGCAVVLLARLGLNDLLAEQARLLPFVLPVMAAAWWGGLGSGLFATLLSVLLGLIFIIPPHHSIWVDAFSDGLNAAMFVVAGATISVLSESLHAARLRATETEKQFHTLADSIPQLVWMARPNGERFWFNKRWYEYTGATLEQSQGWSWQSLHDSAEFPRVSESWKRALAKGEPWEDIHPLRRSDGQMRWHLCRAVPVKNARGETVCWFGTNTDIQDRIEFEQSLKDADARKDQFLATLAHELRNPLSPISNALQLWPDVEGDKQELDQLRTVMERQVQQLIRLIDDLMDVSRISRGKITLRRQPVELRALIAGAIEAVRPMVDACDHRLSVTAAEEPIMIHGDAARLTQVFSNILNNAAKYTSPHGAIWVSTEREGDQAVIRVRDNGRGIPPELLHEIFEAFRQVETALDRSHGGLGIGLTLAKQLVELHGGTIEAHSEGPDKGSEFVVRLPVLRAAATTGGAQSPPPAKSPRAMPRHRILVVDDLRESAETLAMVLRSMGQDVTALSDGESAIHWILAHHPDAVLLDIGMPKLDGYEVARRLRQHPELQSMFLVALTGYGQQSDRKRAFEVGFNHHLTKPTNIDALEDMLGRLPSGGQLTESAVA